MWKMASISIYSAHKVFSSSKRWTQPSTQCSGKQGSWGTVLVSKWDRAGKSVWVWLLVGKAYFFFYESREECLSKGPFILGLEPLGIRNICIYIVSLLRTCQPFKKLTLLELSTSFYFARKSEQKHIKLASNCASVLSTDLRGAQKTDWELFLTKGISLEMKDSGLLVLQLWEGKLEEERAPHPLVFTG